MKIKLFQVDAFASQVFEGNPAAVCPLEKWLPDEVLQKIAQENNLSETAFFVEDNGVFSLRWFTPQAEVDLCGHATLAAAHVLFKHFGYTDSSVRFQTKSGELVVAQDASNYIMDFPSSMPTPIEIPNTLVEALGIMPKQVLTAFDYIVVLENEAQLRAVTPNFNKLNELDLRGVVITAKGDDVDFVSRCFFPKLRVNEDPVTGSAHCELTPYWCGVFNRHTLSAKQLSERTGFIECVQKGSRVILKGSAIDYMQGTISI